MKLDDVPANVDRGVIAVDSSGLHPNVGLHLIVRSGMVCVWRRLSVTLRTPVPS